MTAAGAMTPGPLTATPRASVAAAPRRTGDDGIAHLPVVDRGRIERGAHEALVVEKDRLVGILTHSDLLRALIVNPEAVA